MLATCVRREQRVKVISKPARIPDAGRSGAAANLHSSRQGCSAHDFLHECLSQDSCKSSNGVGVE